MSVGEIPVTIVGNLTADPEVRFTQGGAQMARFTVASTPRAYNKATGAWEDGTATFLRCTAWRDLADHAAESLTKGTRVIVSGRLRQFDWKTDDGQNRSMLAIEVDEIGPSLRFATAKVTKAQRTGSPASGAPDAWAGGTPAPADAGFGGPGYSDEPPF